MASSREGLAATSVAAAIPVAEPAMAGCLETFARFECAGTAEEGKISKRIS
jgi:hypothetical protein